MAQTIISIEKTNVISQLDTYNYTIPASFPSSMATMSIDMSEQPASGLSVIFKKNGSAIATAAAPAAMQNHIPLKVTIACVPTDVLSMVLSSSNINDQNINAIRGILRITPGSN